MEDKFSNALDGVALNQKRKRDTQCDAHLTEVSTPKNLVGDEDQSTEFASRSLVNYYLNYKKSGLPKRLMFYKNGEWLDYHDDVVDFVKKYFKIKKAVVELDLDGQDIVLDFWHMYSVNLRTGLQQPIAWIDEVGRCFFPELFGGSDEEREHEGGESSNKDREIELDAYTEPGYGRLDMDTVHDIFLIGMATFNINDDDIVDIHRISSISMQARLELFHKQVDITKVIHGDANVRYGWFACSKEDLFTMMQYGFGHNALSSFKCIYGFGIHLTAITHPYACVPYCDVDENGVKHLVLCRVIMGKMELLRRGNNQIRPSGCEYDNGVDDIQSPKYYVVWNMNINTHIHPEFVVSFKAPMDAEVDHNIGLITENEHSNESMSNVSENNSSTSDTVNSAGLLTNTRRVPRSPWLPFPMLFAAIRSRISPKQMLVIKAHYALLMAKKISHDDFVMKLRLIVGDNILRSAVTNLQDKGASNDNSNAVTKNV
ncbi:unnamed protein product [Lathyrus sativus]|nr:unnamed protein product [Lathyrus sativus]